MLSVDNYYITMVIKRNDQQSELSKMMARSLRDKLGLASMIILTFCYGRPVISINLSNFSLISCGSAGASYCFLAPSPGVLLMPFLSY